MALQEHVLRSIVSQFARPRGVPGHVAGWIMGRRASNVERNQWVVSLLEVRPTDRILEVGCGPGVALGEMARRAPEGSVCGLDHSRVMVEQAKRRNAVAI